MDFDEASEDFPDNPGDYESIDGRSSGIIDFDAMPGFGFRWGSPLSSRFERSIRLMIIPPFPTIGFTYSSRPLPSMAMQAALATEEAQALQMEAAQRDDADDGAGGEQSEPLRDEEQNEETAHKRSLFRPLDIPPVRGPDSELDASVSKTSADIESDASKGHFTLSAEATFDGMVQGMYMHRFNRNWNMRHMILTSMEPGKSMLMSSLSFSAARFSSRLSWSSERDRISVSVMRALSQRIAVGGDVGYSFKDKQRLGWSVGARYTLREVGSGKFAATHITLGYNHLGRIKTTYVLPFSETVFASARYTVNAFSFKSNMAVGVESFPSATLPVMAKAKWDTSKGIGISLGLHFGLAAMMFNASYGKEGPMIGLHFEL